MTRDPQVVSPDTSLVEAARLMKSLDSGFLPVGDVSHVIGCVTDRDIAIRAIADGRDPGGTSVREVMSEFVETLSQDAEVHEAAKLMERQQIRRLVVTDEDGRCVGVVSLGDLAIKTHDEALCGEILEEVSEPAHSAR